MAEENEVFVPPAFVAWDDQPKVGTAEKLFKVTDEIFLGTVYGAEDGAALREHGIEVIVNCTCDPSGLGLRKVSEVAVPNHFEGEFVYVNYDLRDHTGEDIRPAARAAVAVLGEHVAAGRKVLVHCSGGLSRSVTIILAYLITARKLTMRQAVLQVWRARQRQVQCNPSFWSALVEIERQAFALPDTAPPSFDYTDWVVDDFSRMGFDAAHVKQGLQRCNWNADQLLEGLLDGSIIVQEEKVMI